MAYAIQGFACTAHGETVLATVEFCWHIMRLDMCLARWQVFARHVCDCVSGFSVSGIVFLARQCKVHHAHTSHWHIHPCASSML